MVYIHDTIDILEMFPVFHVFLPVFIWELWKLLSPKKTLKNVPVYRFWLILGSILPDLVDKPLTMLFPTVFSGRGITHAPFIIMIFCGILYFLVKRKDMVISLVIGMIFHILLDLPGSIPWFWPFVDYPILPADIDSYFYTLLHNPLIITTELIGLVGGIMILWKYHILFYRKVVIDWDNLKMFLFQDPKKT